MKIWPRGCNGPLATVLLKASFYHGILGIEGDTTRLLKVKIHYSQDLELNMLHRHQMNVEEYIPNVRTVFIWKLNITSYEAPIFSPKFYSTLRGHYCMLRVAFISVPSKTGAAKSVRFGIYFHITRCVFSFRYILC